MVTKGTRGPGQEDFRKTGASTETEKERNRDSSSTPRAKVSRVQTGDSEPEDRRTGTSGKPPVLGSL